MADPVTMGTIAIGSAVAGGIVGGMGASQSATASATAYQYKAGVALLNKQISEQNAAWAIQAGGIQSEEAGLKARQEIGQTKVIQSGSNLDVNSGSAATVRKTQTDVAQFDEGVIKWDAAKTAYGYEAKAIGDEAESHLDQMASDDAIEAGKINVAASFINAAGSVSSKWMQGKSAGLWG